MKFIHFTDPHIIPPGQELYGLRPDQRLSALIDHISAHHSDAECALVTGDLTHWGDLTSYKHLKQMLATLPFPVHLLIGNHDLRPNFQEVFPDTRRDTEGLVQYTIDTSEGVLIVCDTVLEGTHAGWFDEARQGWLKSELRKAAPKPAFLFMHHPPFNVGIAEMDAIKIQQSEALADILSVHSHVKHLFFGHIHRPIHGVWKDIPFTTLYGLSHQVALNLDPSIPIKFTHERPSYNVVLLTQDQTTIHMVDYIYKGPVINDEDGAPASAKTETA